MVCYLSFAAANNRFGFLSNPTFIAIVFSAFFCSQSAADTTNASLRCQWKDPVSLSNLTASYSKPALLFAAPDSVIRCQIVSSQSTWKITRLAHGEGSSSLTTMEIHKAPAVRFKVPKSPSSNLIIIDAVSGGISRQFSFTCAVAVPATVTGVGSRKTISVNSTVLGTYSSPSESRNRKVKNHSNAYNPPLYYGQITSGNLNLCLTPNLMVKSMVIASENSNLRHSRYFPVNYRAWFAFDTMRKCFSKAGLPAGNLRHLSSFRTPDYNRKIQSSSFSRHPYGDAFDFFFDGNSDGRADDLNGDGKVNTEDAQLVVDAIEEAQATGELPIGGIGFYYFPNVTRKHRLTFHVDFRQHRAVWAYAYDRKGRPSEIKWKSRFFTADGTIAVVNSQ